MVKRKKIVVENVSISYLEKQGSENVTLFLIHGNSGAANMWESQLNYSPFFSIRIVSFDLPGHGDSDWLDTQQYSVLSLARLIAIAVKELAGTHKFFLAGFSLGTNLVAETLKLDLVPLGLILISPTIIGSGFSPKENFHRETTLAFSVNTLKDEEVRKVLEHGAITGYRTEIDQLMRFYKNVDPGFRPSLFMATKNKKFNDEIILLKNSKIPLLILLGASDPFVNTSYLDSADLPLWGGQIIKIGNDGHFLPLTNSSIINNYIKHYMMARNKEILLF